jgi:hypothetical protein
MIAQLIGFNQADRNANDCPYKQLTVKAVNDTITNEQRGMIQAEINQPTDEIDQVVSRVADTGYG